MTFKNYLSRNNIRGYLDAGLSASATTMIMQVAYEGIFPEPTVDRKYLATIERLDDEGNVAKREIVKVLTKSVNTFTIERSAGYCLASFDALTYTNTPQAFFPGDIVSLYVVSEDIQDVKDEVVRVAGDITDVRINGTDRLKVIEAISGTPLRVDIGAGSYLVGASMGLYAGSVDNVVTDSATNYIQINVSGVIQINTVAWDPNYARLAIVTCAGGVVTAIEDRRSDVVGGNLAGAIIPYNTVTAKTKNTTYQAGAKGGLLVVFEDYNTGADLAINYKIYSDASVAPTTLVGGGKFNDNTAITDTASIPILPNHYYKVTSSETDCYINFYENI